MRRRGLAVVVALLAGACGGASELDRATLRIDTGSHAVELRVQLAKSDEARRRGLMERERLPEDAGMLFLFPDERSGGFWMKNTPLPLSIAFLDRRGRILSMLDMDPCRADPCPVYDPGHPYRAALEVKQGAFDRLGIEVGDVATLVESDG